MAEVLHVLCFVAVGLIGYALGSRRARPESPREVPNGTVVEYTTGPRYVHQCEKGFTFEFFPGQGCAFCDYQAPKPEGCDVVEIDDNEDDL